MARTEQQKLSELVGMILRDCGRLPELPALEIVREEIEEDFDDGTKEAWEHYLNRD